LRRSGGLRTIRGLTELSALAAGGLPAEEAVQRTLSLLREGLGAEDVFLVYGHEAGFQSFGTAELGLSDVALWLVHQDLTSRREQASFDEHDGRVEGFRSASARRACANVASLIPMPVATGDMLLARGRWPKGLGTARLRFLRSALPAVALILEQRLDFSRAERRRNQLSAIANITSVLSEAEDMETVLESIAGTIAAVTNIDYVSIDLVDADGTVKLRCVTSSRPGTEALRERWTRGANRPDSVRDAVLSTRMPMLFADAQRDERIPEGGRNFFVRTLIRSTALLPLLTKEEVLGVLSLASHRPLRFTAEEVDLYEGLAAQVATAVKGINLYHQLAESRAELQRVNAQLQESMGIEHHLARTDALTGNTNRRFIEETVNTEVARVRRYGQQLSVVMADVDDLKSINDAYGHHTGDEMLRFVAELARGTCRTVDVVGRYGGDEFVFVLPATSREEAAAFAERFRCHLAGSPVPTTSAGGTLRVTISLGVAQWDDHDMNEAACLIRQADRAMYAAKTDGRNRTMVAIGNAARAA